MIIDAYSHVYPKKLMKEFVPFLKEGSDPYYNFFRIRANDPEAANYSDEQARIKYLDRFGIDIEAVNMNVVFFESLPKADLLRMTRLANDTVAEFAASNPERIIPIGFIPHLEGEYLDELDRSIKDLGMKGCVIFTNNFGRPLDSQEFLGFYSKMEKYDLPLFLHPSNHNYYPWIWNYRLNFIFGWPFDTSLALGSLVFGGVLERYPKLKIVSHHLGGMIPFFGERIRGFYDDYMQHPYEAGANAYPFAEKMSAEGQHPIDQFKKIYADTATSGSAIALRCGYDFYGKDRVLFGTDYPFGPMGGDVWTELILDNVRKLDIPAEAKSLVWEKNARALFRLS